MSNKKLKNLMISSSLTLLSFNTLAESTYFEARNDAMGGTGVASSHYSAAPLANPALLTKYAENDHASILLPAVGANIELSDTFDKIDKKIKYFQEIAGENNGSDNPSTAKTFREALESLHGTGANAQVGASTAIAIPNDTLPFAFMMKTYGIISAKINITDADIESLRQLENSSTPSNNGTFTSHLSGGVAVISEVGVSFAKELKTAGKTWSLGITPKFQRMDVFYKNILFSESSTNDEGNLEIETKNGLNADIGAYTDLYDDWTLGLAIQNVIPRTVDTKTSNSVNDTFNIRPQAKVAVAWNHQLLNVAFDLDLTPSSGFASDKKRQFASLGGEFDIYKWAQIRAGYRQNMRSNEGSAFTAGIGISPFNVIHFDIATMIGTDTSYGAVAQLKMTF